MSAEFHYAVGVGGNIGDVPATLRAAARWLEGDGLIVLAAEAPLIGTDPVGGPVGQPRFVNGAWILATSLGPHQLLHRLQRAETEFGRIRNLHWGPRTIDLDLLLREDGCTCASPVLTLPHPRLAERAFVLKPLAVIAPRWRVPPLGCTVAELSAACP